jgi:hypothetical protein
MNVISYGTAGSLLQVSYLHFTFHYTVFHWAKLIIKSDPEVSLRKQTPAWLVLCGMVIFVLGAVLGWYGFPALVRSQIISVSTNGQLLFLAHNVPYRTGFDFASVHLEEQLKLCKLEPASPIPLPVSSASFITTGSHFLCNGETNYPPLLVFHFSFNCLSEMQMPSVPCAFLSNRSDILVYLEWISWFSLALCLHFHFLFSLSEDQAEHVCR